ncbi:PLP-dependent aminotransferase family protein [Halosquirtibacter xylanolyticus]|uniref:MocR-like pyridoxine biosynthesis transcription factor PdxR n=1 Tax=Halosquirtibacter xylanolyticus TaxID=3374599 RepID=UPI003749B377|nr:PLP-dependent aminotransferase family protein [Prolixibacteraceae bacterium]
MRRLWNFDLDINFNSKKAIYIQIADAIIEAIKDERLKANDILPSTRKLAEHIGVNRNTLIKSIDILIAEGWLNSKDRVGIFVANVNIKSTKKQTIPKRSTQSTPQHHIILDDGTPNTKISPIKELASAYRRVFALKSKHNIMGYSDPLGTLELRELISQMLNHKLNIQTSVDEICITRGSQMALYLTAHVLLTAGDVVLVENPGYKPAWRAFESTQAKLIPIDVDLDGIVIEDIEKQLANHDNIKAIYLTPHHQYPTTVTLSLKRRIRLIELANQYDLTIIEDDYDHDFHFGKRPILPISSHSNLKKYVYVSSFSKIIAPALRIGYMTSSFDLIDKVSSLREIIDVQNDTIMELSLSELIKTGELKRHIKRATKYYQDKRLYLDELLQTYLKSKVKYNIPIGGMAFWIRPIKDLHMPDLIHKLRESSNYEFEKLNVGFRLGYGSIEKEDLKTTIIKLDEIL